MINRSAYLASPDIPTSPLQVLLLPPTPPAPPTLTPTLTSLACSYPDSPLLTTATCMTHVASLNMKHRYTFKPVYLYYFLLLFVLK